MPGMPMLTSWALHIFGRKFWCLNGRFRADGMPNVCAIRYFKTTDPDKSETNLRKIRETRFILKQ